jgi:hypothetical protein
VAWWGMGEKREAEKQRKMHEKKRENRFLLKG